VGIDGGLAASRCDHVDIRVMGRVAGYAGADFEHLGVTLRAVLQAMPVRISGRKPGRIARAQNLLAAIGDEHDLAGNDVNELVAAGMPVTLARPGAWRQAKQVYTPNYESPTGSPSFVLSRERQGTSNGDG